VKIISINGDINALIRIAERKYQTRCAGF